MRVAVVWRTFSHWSTDDALRIILDAGVGGGLRQKARKKKGEGRVGLHGHTAVALIVRVNGVEVEGFIRLQATERFEKVDSKRHLSLHCGAACGSAHVIVNCSVCSP